MHTEWPNPGHDWTQGPCIVFPPPPLHVINLAAQQTLCDKSIKMRIKLPCTADVATIMTTWRATHLPPFLGPDQTGLVRARAGTLLGHVLLYNQLRCAYSNLLIRVLMSQAL